MSSDADLPGWFGKIACLGDFASRRLNQDVVRKLDAWLAQGVDASRARLGEQWLNAYLTSALWRFVWAPGVLDARWWFGVTMPSVDNVGRYFPLVVLQSRAAPPTSGDMLNALEHWFLAMAECAMGTLHQGSSLDGFEASLHAAVQRAALPTANEIDVARPAPSAHRVRFDIAAESSMAEWVSAITIDECLRRLQGATMWWPLRPGSEGASSATLAAGLPSGDAYAQMLDGSW